MSSFLRFTIELRAPLLVAMPTGNPNNVQSTPYLPGSVVRGAFATLVQRRAPQQFDDLVLSGAVRFLPAYPVSVPQAGGAPRSIPTPTTWMRERGSRQAMCDVARGTIELAELERAPWSFVDPQSLEVVDCELESQFHHSRDRKAGRATAITGAIFTYEAIRAGTVLAGTVCVSGTVEEQSRRLKALRELMQHEGEEILTEVEEQSRRLKALREAAKGGLRFGRSQHVQYGGDPLFRWADTPQHREHLNATEGLLRHLVTDGVAEGAEFAALLTSDALVRDANSGAIDPSALSNEFHESLQGKAQVLEVLGTTGLVGGYNSHWRLAVPVGRAIRAGCVVLLRARAIIAQSELDAVEGAGIGERRSEGYGALLFLSATSPTPAGNFSIVPHRARRQPQGSPSTTLPQQLLALERRMMLAACLEAVEGEVGRLAKAANGIPKRSLLGRLRAPLQAGPAGLDDLRAWLDKKGEHRLRPAAMKQLERCELTKALFRDKPGELYAADRRFLDEWLRAMSADTPDGRVTWALIERGQLRRFAIDDEKQALRRLAGSLDAEVRVRLVDRLLHVLARSTQHEDR